MEYKKRKLGIDYGKKRIGVAVSDLLGITARGIGIIYWDGKDISSPVDKIMEYAREYDVDEIVVGLPRRTDGSLGDMAENAQDMVRELMKISGDIKIEMYDERFTSAIANKIIRDKGRVPNRKSGQTDMMAAEILLSDYLRYREKVI